MHSPLEQFVVSPLLKFGFQGMDLSFTNSSLAIVTALLMIFLIFTVGLLQEQRVPGRMQALVEMFYEFVTDLIESNVGRSGRQYFPFVFSIFLFVLFGNLVGLIPYMFTFTSHIIATFTLAVVVFIFITILGIILHGAKFFSLFAPSGVPKFMLLLFVPIEMISYLSRPVSLSIRLFANMVAGHTMMKVFAGFVAMLGIWGVAPMLMNVILTGFELFVAILQAYIFTLLTCVYLHDAVHLH